MDGDRYTADFRLWAAVDASDVYRQMREERGVHHGSPFLGLQAL
ncbi:hypothetical protein [Streptomyces coeruleorubidus]